MASKGSGGHRPGHSGQPRTKLGFDITKPLKVGHLRKQGEKGAKIFKRRFFVLYTNFLVYYTDPIDWESDKTYQAFRLRKGAVKLHGGSCKAAMASGVPKECIAAFILHAPDPNNKRQTYLLDTTNAEEQTAWIEALNDANPSSKEPAKQ